MKADFFIEEVTDKYILILDLHDMFGNMTITNDVEAVVEHISKLGILEDKDLYYVSTDGRVDKIQHSDGKFVSFLPGYENIDEFNKVKDTL